MAERLLLIGWDAADWRLLRPLLTAGKMPHLQGLIARGTSGDLATLQPAMSPLLWTSIATGKRAHKHGILGFAETDPASGQTRPVTNLSRRTKALWNILSQSGRSSNVVGWWPSHPAEPIRGVMVSDYFQRAVAAKDQPWPLLPGTVHPPRLREALAPLRLHPHEVDGETLLPFVPRAAEVDQDKDQSLTTLARVVAENAGVHAAATGLMQLEPWDFMAVYYDGLDHFGHAFMRYHPPARPDAEPQAFELYSGVMETACVWHDHMLGVLLALAGPETRVLLLSDHGFHADHLRPQGVPNEPAGPTAEHRNYGIFVMAGPGIRAGARLSGATLLDIAPTVLHSFGLPVGEDMDGKVLLPVFEKPGTVQRIPSWDSVPGEDGRHPPDTRLDPVDAEAALAQLVALGYVDPLPTDSHGAAVQLRCEERYHLALSYFDARLFGEANAILQELWERWPEESRFGVRLLQGHLALGDAVQARATLELLGPRRAEAAAAAAVDLAALQERLGDLPPWKWSAADRHQHRRLSGRSQIDTRAWQYFTSMVELAEGRLDEAASGLESLLESADPGRRLDLHLQLGTLRQRQRRWAEARAHFQRAVEMDPDLAPGHLGLARAWLFQRRPFEAAAHALRAVELGFHDPRAHFFYGVALLHCGHPEWAAASLQEAVRQAPLYPAAHRRLAGLYSGRLRDRGKALHHLEMALRGTEQLAAQGAGAVAVRQATPMPTPELAPSNFSRRGSVRARAEERITVVTGLPRSGTSLLMQMLAAGGVPPLSDGLRTADASNARGYLELEAVKRLPGDTSWLAGALGHAVKVVVPLVQHLRPEYAYQVIWIERDLSEVLDSQGAMLRRLGREKSAADPAALARIYALQSVRCRRMLLGFPQLDALTLRYTDCLADPTATAAQLAEFLDRPALDQAAMAAAVAPELRRAGAPRP